MCSKCNRKFKSKRVQHDYRNKQIENKKKSICHANANVYLMEENVTQINGGITVNVDVSVQIVMYVKKIMLGILLHAAVKMENI